MECENPKVAEIRKNFMANIFKTNKELSELKTTQLFLYILLVHSERIAFYLAIYLDKLYKSLTVDKNG